MTKSKDRITTALSILLDPGSYALPGICVLAGEDAFLKHEARRALLGHLIEEGDDDLGHVYFEGRSVDLREVLDALRERSLFGSSRQIVVIEDADPFVKQYRTELEAVLQNPFQDATLILEVNSWPGNTRLAKLVADSGLTVSCQVAEKGRERTRYLRELKQWLTQLATREHQIELQPSAADALLEQLPPEPGLLCQELSRLALLAPEKQPLDVALIKEHAGGWRTQKTWDMIDAAVEGRASEALDQLNRLFAAGEDPHALLPQMASTMRRFAAAAKLYEQAEGTSNRISLRLALEQSGMPVFKIQAAESQLKQIGRERARQLYQWLLAADLALKGHNSTKDRARRELEILVIRLARQAAPERTSAR